MKVFTNEYDRNRLPVFDASIEWSAEQSDDVVLITDQDGIGELALTTLARASRAGEEITSTDMPRKNRRKSQSGAAEYGGFTGVIKYLRYRVGIAECTTYGDARYISPTPAMRRITVWMPPRWMRSFRPWCAETPWPPE